ncbi:NADPH:quinone oxidoreductase family protein [Tabrizicola sp.]|uniref:NADPH:quinone oxidoreductase family protein n=1 Tax=Tabrizicola sp. TaxID=2005166 RepID=UPI003F2DE218
MRAWHILSLGSQPVQTRLSRPVPAKGEALVRVSAVGINFADLLMAEGRYQTRPALPFVPGMEFSGTVTALGPDTTGPAPGTAVLGLPGNGALAEELCVAADALSILPAGMSMTDAAGFPIAYATAHLALTHTARLKPGETLLVTGAAGGVGLTAVEIGKRLGARVIASARGDAKLAVARTAGADHLIDSDAPGMKEALRALGGVDVVFDAVGGPAFDEAMRAAKPDGRLLAIGFASGQVPQVAANLLLVKNLTVSGFWLGGYQATAPTLVSHSLTTLLGWYAEGALRPHVSHILPFDSYPQALELLRSRAATGKVVVTLD